MAQMHPEALRRMREDCIRLEKTFFSRILFPNPVCLLTANVPETGERNIMTISWLTPVNNQGGFLCSINKRRHTLKLIQARKRFVLSVPVRGMEDLLVAIGGCTGVEVDKFREFGIPLCHPGWHALKEARAEPQEPQPQEQPPQGLPAGAGGAPDTPGVSRHRRLLRTAMDADLAIDLIDEAVNAALEEFTLGPELGGPATARSAADSFSDVPPSPGPEPPASPLPGGPAASSSPRPSSAAGGRRASGPSPDGLYPAPAPPFSPAPPAVRRPPSARLASASSAPASSSSVPEGPGAAGRKARESVTEFFAVAGCAAHLVCRVDDVPLPSPDGEHELLSCRVLAAFVQKGYWDGRSFCARDGTVPPALSFLGSKQFAYIARPESLVTEQGTPPRPASARGGGRGRSYADESHTVL
eukprot:tig00021037_g17434.t1